MLESNAYVQGHRTLQPYIGPLTTYTWQGPEDGIALISFNELARARKQEIKVGSIIKLGDLRLRIIDTAYFSQSYYVMLDTSWAELLQRTLTLRRLLRIIYLRLIVTAAVWGLADYEDGIIPSWRDVHFLSRIDSWLKSRGGSHGE